jgi:type I restriction enzyme S subunit
MISMFPQNGETKPRVRFKGFDDEWKCAKLEDYLVISSEKNSKGIFDKNDVLSVSDDFGVMNQIELLGRSYAGKSVLNYHILQAGEVVYTKSPLKSKPYGIIKMNNGKAGIVSVLYAVYKVKDNALAEYIHYYFDPSWRLNQYMRPLVNKGAKNTMNISDETALTGYILIPNDIEEQRKIASFFTNLDRQIALETQRLEKLKQIKSACLDKMFV